MTAVAQEYVIDPELYAEIELMVGNHLTREDGMCFMEAAAFLAGEEHNDHPHCVSQALGSFGRALNDALEPTLRQDLKPFIPALLGTRGDGYDPARSFMAFDWLVRTWLPKWVGLIASKSPALRLCHKQLSTLEPIRDHDSLRKAIPVVDKAYEVVRAHALTLGVEKLRPSNILARLVQKSGYLAAANTSLHALYPLKQQGVVDTISYAALYAANSYDALLPPVVDELQLSAIDLFAEMTKAPVLPTQ